MNEEAFERERARKAVALKEFKHHGGYDVLVELVDMERVECLRIWSIDEQKTIEEKIALQERMKAWTKIKMLIDVKIEEHDAIMNRTIEMEKALEEQARQVAEHQLDAAKRSHQMTS